ncbi:MAG: hypothetical protein O3B90_11800 [Actinomycetota bacterium]|nr:hypothetical protein [Actinomycetota bacterium]
MEEIPMEGRQDLYWLDRYPGNSPVFSYDDPAVSDEFDHVMTAMAARCPLAHSPTTDSGPGVASFFSMDDVREVCRRSDDFSSEGGWILNRPDGIPTMIPIELDEPRHRYWRTSLNRFFGPGTVDEMSPRINAIADELIDKLIVKDAPDFLQDFASPLAQLIVARILLGLPEEDMPELVQHVTRANFGVERDDGSRDLSPEAFQNVYDYAREVISGPHPPTRKPSSLE